MNDTKANVDSAAHRIFFDAILHPHRSLNPFGFKLLMATIAFMMLSIGTLIPRHTVMMPTRDHHVESGTRGVAPPRMSMIDD